ncbi:MAG: hypothetical protein FWG64_13735 [Firmicutes bacterium]|nr:hypothetical protein [Bacillota bacterium]
MTNMTKTEKKFAIAIGILAHLLIIAIVKIVFLQRELQQFSEMYEDETEAYTKVLNHYKNSMKNEKEQ